MTLEEELASAGAQPAPSWYRQGVLDPARRGKPLDLVLLARYRAAAGAERRQLLNVLVWENEPLCMVLVDQLCGRGEARRHAVRLGGCDGFKDLEWADAMQAGLLALTKAMDSYDPSKGKLPYHLLLKVRYELQCLVQREGLSKAPRGETALSFDLIGEQRELDELSSERESSGLATAEGFDGADVQRWAATGEWPEDLEEARTDAARARFERLRRDPAAWLLAAMPRLYVFRRASRIALWQAFNDYRLDCRHHRAAELPRPDYVDIMLERGVRMGWVRKRGGGSEQALAGLGTLVATH